eukprot:2006281-Amphidinium_carterae.1
MARWLQWLSFAANLVLASHAIHTPQQPEVVPSCDLVSLAYLGWPNMETTSAQSNAAKVPT